MATAHEHYEKHLARVYLWMAGGLEVALAAGTKDVEPLGPGPGLAVDLGAGFGMHAIPLARAGWDVVALDSSRELLTTLRDAAGSLSVRPVEADLLSFRAHLSEAPSLVVCFGDTLTHLASRADVDRLFADVAATLAPGGRFVTTFRDSTRLPAGEARFIPVRSDADRIATCFLEEEADHVRVHDLLHERSETGWTLRVSSYRKLRLAPEAVAAGLREAGLDAEVSAGPRGMVCVMATRG